MIGGLTGNNSNSSITNCYSTGAVIAGENPEYVGGLVGSQTGQVINCFWDIQSSGQATSAGGTGRTTEQMQIARTFYVWGISEDELVWTIDEGNDYPRLCWENQSGKTIEPIFLSDYLLGTGLEDDPYLIYTPEQLNLIGIGVRDWSRHFKLMADIDLSTYQ